MLDLILAYGAGVLSLLAFLHFAPKDAQGAPEIPTTLDGFGQILSHEAQAIVKRLDALEACFNPERIDKMISAAMEQAIADLKAAIDAKVAEAIGPAADAAATSADLARDAEDVGAVQALTAQVAAG